MRLLLVDHLSPSGHKKFDSIHISALHGLGNELHLIGKVGQFDDIAKKENICISYLPNWMFTSLPIKPLTERLMGIIRLIWLMLYVRTKRFDVVIFLSYDVLSLFIYRIRGRVYLINHNNVSQINDSKIKLMLTRSLPLNYVHVVLNQVMEQRTKELLPSKKVVYVPHGFMIDKGKEKKPDYIEGDEKFLFCPVNNNYNQDFVKRLFSSCLLKDFLSKNNIKLIIKEKLYQNERNSQLLRIKGRIPEEEYRFCLKNAMAVILPYSKDFRYRCSGILYECIALDTPVIASHIEAMKIYENKVQIQLFNDDVDLVECIKLLLGYKKVVMDKSMFSPDKYWKSLLTLLNSDK